MWTELSSDNDIQTQPPNFYAFDASVKINHTKNDIIALAQKRGLTNIVDYREEPSNGDYREIGVVAQATAPGSIPWSLPWPLSMGDSSKVLRAWVTPPESQAVPTAPQTTPRSPAAMSLGVALGALIVGAVGVYIFRKKR